MTSNLSHHMIAFRQYKYVDYEIHRKLKSSNKTTIKYIFYIYQNVLFHILFGYQAMENQTIKCNPKKPDN